MLASGCWSHCSSFAGGGFGGGGASVARLAVVTMDQIPNFELNLHVPGVCSEAHSARTRLHLPEPRVSPSSRCNPCSRAAGHHVAGAACACAHELTRCARTYSPPRHMLIFTQSLTHAPLRRRRALAVSATWRREKTLRRDAAASAIDVGIRRGPAAALLSADCDACTAAAAAWRSSAVCARAARAAIMTRESAETLDLSLSAGISD